MKRIMFLMLLALTMASSLVAGTLAMYTTSIDKLADGGVVAKEFVFVGDGTDTFQQGIKIAPSETVKWQFKVKNYQKQVVTETDLYYKLTFNVKASANKNAIQPLKVTVKDTDGNVLKSVTGTGTFDVLGAFPLSENGQEKDYIVEINWPSNGTTDINYAGGNFGTTVNVNAAASQLPLSTDHPIPENPQGDISVRYETSKPWQNGESGSYQYQYKVTITNHSDKTIEDWNIAFALPTDRITGAWSNAKLVSGQQEGSYKFINPAYNNAATDDILPGQRVSFTGPALGRGTEPITNITVGGSNVSPSSNVKLTYQFGKDSLN
jgi:hypothetical protein